MNVSAAIFPETCCICGRLACGLCLRCARLLTPHYTIECLSCGNNSSDVVSPCVLCHKMREGVKVLACWKYEKSIARAIWRLKYEKNPWIMTHLARHMPPHILSLLFGLCRTQPNVVCTPIPLHAKHEKARGFNQALLIARAIELLVGIPTKENILIKTKESKQQARSGARQHRIINIHGAFQASDAANHLKGALLLVDDVITTGSTMRDAVRAVRHKNKTVQIVAVSLAREHE